MFAESKFDDFKSMTYWRNFILAVSLFEKPLQTCSVLIRSTLRAKNLLPSGSKLFPLRVAPFIILMGGFTPLSLLFY